MSFLTLSVGRSEAEQRLDDASSIRRADGTGVAHEIRDDALVLAINLKKRGKICPYVLREVQFEIAQA